MNGWSNQQTWNVALWLNNDEPLYFAMVKYCKTNVQPTYEGLIEHLGLRNSKTPDGYKWLSKQINKKEMQEMLDEVKNGN